MSIPKIIHLCWFGKSDYPTLAKLCIDSWKKYLPDYEIMVWNEDNFDINICSYTQKAYEEKRWAFVSDYARLAVLYEYGGVYMDTDLEVIKDFSPLLAGERFVSSYIEGGIITAGYIACEPKHPFVKALLGYYDAESEKLKQGQDIHYIMNPLIFAKIAMENYDFRLTDQQFDNDEITIYPIDYFMPYKKIAFGSSYGHWRYHITQNTCTIHHDMSSWHKRGKLDKWIKGLVRLITPENVYISMKIKNNLLKIEKMSHSAETS